MMTTSSKARGLTIVEVLVALAIIGTLLAVFSTSVTSNFSHTRQTGQTTQATQILNYISKEVTTGSNTFLPTAAAPLTSWDYGQLSSQFPNLNLTSGLSNSALYKATVTHAGQITVGSNTVTQYNMSVCFKQASTEKCLSGVTFGGSDAADAS